jgi:WD40 repeat protein
MVWALRWPMAVFSCGICARKPFSIPSAPIESALRPLLLTRLVGHCLLSLLWLTSLLMRVQTLVPSCLAFSLSGRVLFAGYEDPTMYVRGLHVSACTRSQLLAFLCALCVRHVWDTQLATIASTFTHDNRVTSLALAPDGAALCTAGFDTSVRIWA